MEKTSAFKNIPEQLLYANILLYLNLIGLFILLTGFTLYLTGVITPIVPIEELPRFWSLSLNEYMEKSNMPPDGCGYQTLGTEISLRCLV